VQLPKIRDILQHPYFSTFPNQLAQCSQRGSPSVLSQDEDGRLFVVPSRPPAKSPDDSKWRTSGPAVPHRHINPCNLSYRPFDSLPKDMSFETKRQELRLLKIASPISISSLTCICSAAHCRSQEPTRCTTQDTRSRTAVMAKGYLHTLNWAEVWNFEYNWNYANIKIPNGFLRCGILKWN